MDALVGRTLGNYKIIKEIGQGGMGAVYRAVHVSRGYQVALKVLFPQYSQDPAFLRRFEREARILMVLHHPNIVRVYEAGQTGGALSPSKGGPAFIAMEYIDGRPLSDHVGHGWPMELSAAVRTVKQVADALDYAHAQGLIHRDVKPGNVLVTRGGRAVLTDFGLVTAAAFSKLTQSGTTLGTPTYMSPEQIRGQRVDHRADLYSLAIVTYGMLTGRLPFVRENAQAILYAHVHEAPPPLRAFNPRLPANVEAAVLRALAKNPGARYLSAGDFARALAASAGVAVTSTPRFGRAALPSSAWQTVAGVGLATIFALIVLVAAFYGSNGQPPTSPPLTGRIAFESTRDGNKEIYVMDVGGKGPQGLTDNTVTDWAPAWSPNGRKIAFVIGHRMAARSSLPGNAAPVASGIST